MNSSILERDATIKTAVVEIKTMVVSGKQMTLSVFRQLPEKPVINPKTGEIRGEVWGKVNYFWNNCHVNRHGSTMSPHIHIVWSDGYQLFRCAVYEWIYQPGVSLDCRDEYAVSFRMLEATDQLFIAV